MQKCTIANRTCYRLCNNCFANENTINEYIKTFGNTEPRRPTETHTEFSLGKSDSTYTSIDIMCTNGGY